MRSPLPVPVDAVAAPPPDIAPEAGVPEAAAPLAAAPVSADWLAGAGVVVAAGAAAAPFVALSAGGALFVSDTLQAPSRSIASAAAVRAGRRRVIIMKISSVK